MDLVLQQSLTDKRKLFILDIPAIDDVAATLYLLNGGASPPTPAVGDFAYDFVQGTFEVYHTNGWRIFTVEDVKSLLRHPKGIPLIVTFTASGIPFWKEMSRGQVAQRCNFSNVQDLLSQFRQKFESSKLKVITLPPSPSLTNPKSHKRDIQDGSEGEEDEGVRSKRPCLPAGPSTRTLHLDYASRFIKTSVGFPEGSERVLWDAGFETHVPFAGKFCSQDTEGMVVKELAKRPSLERSGSLPCGPDPDGFRVRDLVAELELDPALKAPGYFDSEVTESAWKKILGKIKFYMAQSTTVVVRGCTPQLRLSFSKASMALQFGNLGQPCQWVEGTQYAASQDDPIEDVVFHKNTTLEEFIDRVKDTKICGNFMDSKDLNSCPPFWATPLLDSTNAWNHTMHLRFSQKAKKNKKDQPVEIERGTPKVIQSATWTSQGWRLVTHPGFITFPHHDCCGWCSYVVGNSGAKIWAVMRPKRKNCPSTLQGVQEFTEATKLSKEGNYSDADIATVCLEEFDVMFQPPGVLHCVYTPVPSIFSGGYFYHYETMHLTRAVLSMIPVEEEGSLTNDERPGFFRTLCRMLIALRYRSEPRKIGKRSLISLALIILDQEHRQKHLPNSKDSSGLADEERGELAFASTCAEALLKFMNLSLSSAKEFVDSQGPYYSGGDKEVEIPALMKGVPDPIFPDMNDII